MTLFKRLLLHWRSLASIIYAVVYRQAGGAARVAYDGKLCPASVGPTSSCCNLHIFVVHDRLNDVRSVGWCLAAAVRCLAARPSVNSAVRRHPALCSLRNPASMHHRRRRVSTVTRTTHSLTLSAPTAAEVPPTSLPTTNTHTQRKTEKKKNKQKAKIEREDNTMDKIEQCTLVNG